MEMNQRKMRKVTWFLLAGAGMSLFNSPSLAQQVPATNTVTTEQTNAPVSAIESIVVTARKFRERLQDAPIAVSAFTAAGLDDRGMTNLAEISKATPSLTISTGVVSSGNPAATAVFLRGLGQADFMMFTEPAIGIYLDGVYIARSIGSALDFNDVDSVEVLRGPQGSLFGRNTIGGVINVTSRRPAKEFGGDFTAMTGSFNRLQLQGSLNMPVSDTVRTKLSLFSHERDGYVTQIPTGVDLGNTSVTAARFQAEIEPSPKFRATLTADTTRRHENPTPSVAIGISGTGYSPLGVPLAINANNAVLTYNRLLGGICATNPDSSRNCVGSSWLTNDPYRDNGTNVDGSKLDISGVSAVLEWRLENATVKSITAYRKLDAHYGRESDHTPLPFAQIHYDDEQNQLSQELQLNGSSLDNRFRYVVGAYVFKEKAFEHFANQNLGQATTDALINMHNQNVALFGEGTYDLTKGLHLTFGGRYTKETKKFQTDQFVVASPNKALVGVKLISDNREKESDSSQFTPRLILSADVTDGVMAYGTYSKGFKSGGFNGRYTGPLPPPGHAIPFQPEFVTLYEGGLKFSRADRRLRVNVAAFRMDYKDIQVSYRPDPTQAGFSVVGNAAAAKIDGMETEVTWIPLQGLQVEGGFSYLDPRYTALGSGVPTGPGGISLTTPFQQTARWQANLSVSYDFRTSNGASIKPRFDINHRDKVSMDSIDSPTIRQPAYTLVNANITYVPAGSDWRFATGVTNLSDKRYFVAGLFTGAGGIADVVYGRPREWYLSARRDF